MVGERLCGDSDWQQGCLRCVHACAVGCDDRQQSVQRARNQQRAFMLNPVLCMAWPAASTRATSNCCCLIHIIYVSGNRLMRLDRQNPALAI